MIIIGFTDIHGRLPGMNRLKPVLAQADVVLIVGDITNFGRSSDADAVVSPIIELSEKVLAVSGNCDHREVDTYLNQT